MNTHTTPRRAHLFLIAGCSFLIATAVGAQRGPFGKGGFGSGGRGGERLIEYLELDEGQQAEWQAIREASRDEMRSSVEAIRANGQALRELLESGTATAEEAGQLVLDGHALKQDLQASREAIDEQLQAVLTLEQVEKWEAFKAAAGNRGPRFGRGGRRGARGRTGALDGAQ